MADAQSVSRKRGSNASGLVFIKPGQVLNPQGINGLVMLARHLKNLGLVDECGRVLQQALQSSDESVALSACALALRYMFGVPQGEIKDGKPLYDFSKLTPEEVKALDGIRERLRRDSGTGSAPETPLP